MHDRGWKDSPLAVIGMACRLPGANSLDDYWKLILRAGCALGPLPPSRFDEQLYFDARKGIVGKSYSRLGGVVDSPPFDRSVLPLSEAVVAGADPVHLTFLEVASEALRHAGLEPCSLPLRNTGVYVGHARGGLRGANIVCRVHSRVVATHLAESESLRRIAPDEQRRIIDATTARLRDHYGENASSATNLETNRVAGLVAEAFGLSGPAVAVDAACASSLVGLSQAARALQYQQIDMAIVGGASFSAWTSLVLFSHAQALSAIGSFPFDARADGFVSSDGYAAIVVKTLARALADGDRIWGVVRGIGLSSDGRGKSLWAPRREGQVLAIQRALACGIDVSQLGYVEAHGTSTRIGDATEVAALQEGLGCQLSRSNPVPLTSVKANIGHTRETAGVAGLIKTLLAMHHEQIPPAAGFQQPNPEIPWEKLSFHVPTTAARWDRPSSGAPRRAAVDAFGIGGLNVHVLVDQEPEHRPGSVHAVVPSDIGQSFSHRSTTDDACPIAVVGRGVVFPGAHTVAEFHDLLRTGRDPKIEVPVDRWDLELFPELMTLNGNGSAPLLGGFVTGWEYDWRKRRIPPKQIEHADPLQFMVLDAAEQALQEAGCDKGRVERAATAVVIGTVFSGDFFIELTLSMRLPEFQHSVQASLAASGISDPDVARICAEFAEAFSRRYTAHIDETGSYSSSTLASRVGKTFDLQGGAFAVDAGNGSSLAALAAAVDLLRSGSCNAVLCAGAQRALNPCAYDAYHARGCLASGRPQPAFHDTARGFVPGEGCGAVMLRRLADAERDGDTIYGVIRGIGTAINGLDRQRAVQVAALGAVQHAHIAPESVAVVEATGMAVPNVDIDELNGLIAAYGPKQRRQQAWLDSFAGHIGYTQGAAGMASLLKLLSVLGENRLYGSPANLSLVGQSRDFGDALRLVVSSGSVHDDGATMPLLGAVNTISHQGQAWHAVVQRHASTESAVSQHSTPVPARLVRIEATDDDELAELLDRRMSDRAAQTCEVEAFTTPACRRLVIVSNNGEGIDEQLALARSALTDDTAAIAVERRGVFLRTGTSSRPRVAFTFAGQGSQYAGMLQRLVAESAEASTHLRSIDATLAHLGLPAFGQLAWGDAPLLGRELFETQLSVLLADVLMFRTLTTLGIEPDVLAGHSYGEYAALVAGEAWSLEQAIEITRSRSQAIVECGVEGAMLATAAPLHRIEELLHDRDTAQHLFLANHNAPGQTIVAGCRDAILEFQQRLQALGHASRLLSVPAPYHTPLMSPVREAFRSSVSACAIRPPSKPLLSSVTNRFTAEPQELRDNLIEQQVRPVRYVDLVERLVAEGIDIIVEVGPRNVLTSLHRQILGKQRIGVIATDDPQNPGYAQLLRVVALLESRGAVLRASDIPRPGVDRTSGRKPRVICEQGPIVHFDATARRRERNRRASQEAAQVPGTAVAGGQRSSAPENDELADFLIRFVCDHTGYPPEVVDLDAELEADLGIDSIKKAQLLGELREHFPLRPKQSLKLDDFPTLRHILEFIRASQAEAASGDTAAIDLASHSTPAIKHRDPGPQVVGASPPEMRPSAPETAATASSAAEILNLRRFRGSPYEMGWQHGRQEDASIRRTLQRYADLLGARLFEMRPLQAALDQRHVYFGDDGIDELRGMADAVGIPVEHLMAFNYGLSAEFLPGCTQFAVTERWNGAEGLIHAVNEDWMLALALPDTLKRMAQVRFPINGIPSLTFSTCGELAGPNGINARGLAVSSTLLLDRLRRDELAPGRVQPALVKTILERAETIDSALQIIRDLPRSGAWSMCLSHRESDRLCYIEYDATSLEVCWHDDLVESTNHCRLQAALDETPSHSCHRLDRLHELLHGHDGQASKVTLGQAQSILRDRYDRSLGRTTNHPTKATIRRPDTQVSLVMRPVRGEVWVTADSMTAEEPDQFHRVELRSLFEDENDAQVSAFAETPQSAVSAQQCRAVPDRVMNRFVLRMVDQPFRNAAQRARPVTGRVLVVGENPTSEALQRRLSQSGAEVLSLPSFADVDEGLRQLDRIWEAGPVGTLILLTGRDAGAACGLDAEAWDRRRERGVTWPYFLCQRWVQLVQRAPLVETPRMIAATGLGGDFGLSGRSPAVEGGALAGLLKGLCQEFDQIAVRIIDAPLEDPPALVARCLLQELESGADDIEVGYVCGQRRVLRSVPRQITAVEPSLAPNGCWVITGGGRGVTAIVVQELGRRFNLRMHLLGSSPVPEIPVEWRELTPEGRRELRSRIAVEARQSGRDPATAWRDIERRCELDANLREFVQAGVAVTYHPCDVTDRRELARVLDIIRATDGPIQGILHGAGVEASCRFEKKTRENVDRTRAAKVDAAISLLALTRDDPVEFFVGFGSISGRLGGVGQSDYSMSSDLLAKLLCRLRVERPDCRAVTFDWPPWGDVGMAMRPESKLSLEIAGHAFMPALEGAAHVVDELSAGVPEAEVMLIDWPTTHSGRRSPWTPAAAQEHWRCEVAAATAPLIDGIVHFEQQQRVTTEIVFDPERDPFLVHHQIDDVPVLPLVIALEAFAETASLLTDGAIRTLRDVRIQEGLRFPPGGSRRARVDACVDSGSVVCELRSDFRNRRGVVTAPARMHVRAVAEPTVGPATGTVDWPAATGQWHEMRYQSRDRFAIARMVWHGPPLQNLKEFSLEADYLCGRIIAPPGAALCRSPLKPAWQLPSAALDACLLACSMLNYVQKKPFHLPYGFGRLRFVERPAAGEECLVAAHRRDENADRVTYDFTLYGADRRVLVDAQEYQAAVLKTASALA